MPNVILHISGIAQPGRPGSDRSAPARPGTTWFDSARLRPTREERTARELQDDLVKPWVNDMPVITPTSSIAIREQFDEADEVVIRRCDPFEIMNMCGWDIRLFKGSPFNVSCDQMLSFEEMSELAGSSTSLYVFLPVMVASMGAVDWSKVAEMKLAAEESIRANRLDLLDCDQPLFKFVKRQCPGSVFLFRFG